MGKPSSEFRTYDYDYNSRMDWVETAHEDAMWIGHTHQTWDTKPKAEEAMQQQDIAISKADLAKETKRIFWREVWEWSVLFFYIFSYFGLPIVAFILLGTYEVIPSSFAFCGYISWMMFQILISFAFMGIWENSEKEATLKLKQNAQRGDITLIEEKK